MSDSGERPNSPSEQNTTRFAAAAELPRFPTLIRDADVPTNNEGKVSLPAERLAPPPKFPSMVDVSLPSATRVAAVNAANAAEATSVSALDRNAPPSSSGSFTSGAPAGPAERVYSREIQESLQRSVVEPGTGERAMREAGSREWTPADQESYDRLLSAQQADDRQELGDAYLASIDELKLPEYRIRKRPIATQEGSLGAKPQMLATGSASSLEPVHTNEFIAAGDTSWIGGGARTLSKPNESGEVNGPDTDTRDLGIFEPEGSVAIGRATVAEPLEGANKSKYTGQVTGEAVDGSETNLEGASGVGTKTGGLQRKVEAEIGSMKDPDRMGEGEIATSADNVTDARAGKSVQLAAGSTDAMASIATEETVIRQELDTPDWIRNRPVLVPTGAQENRDNEDGGGVGILYEESSRPADVPEYPKSSSEMDSKNALAPSSASMLVSKGSEDGVPGDGTSKLSASGTVEGLKAAGHRPGSSVVDNDSTVALAAAGVVGASVAGGTVVDEFSATDGSAQEEALTGANLQVQGDGCQEALEKVGTSGSKTLIGHVGESGEDVAHDPNREQDQAGVAENSEHDDAYMLNEHATSGEELAEELTSSAEAQDTVEAAHPGRTVDSLNRSVAVLGVPMPLSSPPEVAEKDALLRSKSRIVRRTGSRDLPSVPVFSGNSVSEPSKGLTEGTNDDEVENEEGATAQEQISRSASDLENVLVNVTRDYALLGGHEVAVNDAAFVDSDTLATAGEDGKVCVWNLIGRHVKSEFVPFEGEAVKMVHVIAEKDTDDMLEMNPEAPRAIYIMTLSASKMMRIWRMTGERAVLLKSMQIPLKKTDLVMTLPIIPPGLKTRAAATAAAAIATEKLLDDARNDTIIEEEAMGEGVEGPDASGELEAEAAVKSDSRDSQKRSGFLGMGGLFGRRKNSGT